MSPIILTSIVAVAASRSLPSHVPDQYFGPSFYEIYTGFLPCGSLGIGGYFMKLITKGTDRARDWPKIWTPQWPQGSWQLIKLVKDSKA